MHVRFSRVVGFLRTGLVDLSLRQRAGGIVLQIVESLLGFLHGQLLVQNGLFESIGVR
jgi:hypothetical protein